MDRTVLIASLLVIFWAPIVSQLSQCARQGALQSWRKKSEEVGSVGVGPRQILRTQGLGFRQLIYIYIYIYIYIEREREREREREMSIQREVHG